MGKKSKKHGVRARRRRTSTELVDGSEHVHYEWYMLTGAVLTIAELLPPTVADWRWETKRNAALESFAVHARNLFVFAHATNPKEQDMHAIDWIAKWRSVCPPWPFAQTLDILERGAREIVHLSWDRVLVKNTAWPMAKVVNHFADVGDAFVKHVDSAHLHQKWGHANSAHFYRFVGA